MAMTLHRSIMTAVVSAALALGGVGVAAAHHGNPSEHTTTKGKSRAEIERMERQITAELNRKQAMQGAQLAMATPAPMTEATPAPLMNDEPMMEPMTSDEEASIEGSNELAAQETGN